MSYHVPLLGQNKTISDFPCILHQTFKSRRIPEDVKILREGCIVQHPDYQHFFWTDKDNSKFIQSNYNWFFKTFESYDLSIKRADAVRYFYMYHFGGVYMDLDVKCLKQLSSLLHKYREYDVLLGTMNMHQKRHIRNKIPNVIMISKPKAKFWLDVIQLMSTRNNCSKPEYDTGPEILYDALSMSKHRNTVKLLQPDVFYPIDWSDPDVSWIPHNRRINNDYTHKTAYAVTFWRHSWQVKRSWTVPRRLRTSNPFKKNFSNTAS